MQTVFTELLALYRSETSAANVPDCIYAERPSSLRYNDNERDTYICNNACMCNIANRIELKPVHKR